MREVDQVGGSHYQQGEKPQHWDLVTLYQWDYFQAQITKYLMRWKFKHPTPEKKLEDLKKARSFLDKYIQNYEAHLPKIEDPTPTASPTPTVSVMASDMEGNKFWQLEAFYGDGTNHYSCRHCKSPVRATSPPAMPHLPCAAVLLARPGLSEQGRAV